MTPTGTVIPARGESSGGRHKSRKNPTPSRRFELALYREGIELVAGVDEVGRGCLAGPVLAAAVILPVKPSGLRRIGGVKDSKVLKQAERERLCAEIMRVALASGVGLVGHGFIDRYGIAPASRMAMTKAIGRLGLLPEHVLVDALRLPLVDCRQTAIIDGDALCVSIAAASIIAKVTRDRMMVCAGRHYPGYGFEK